MAVAWRSTSHTSYGGGTVTAITIAKPSGLAVDDILLAVLHIENSSAESVSASGFTLEYYNYGTAGGSPLEIAVLRKRATAGDVAASDFTFSWTSSCWATGDLHAFSGATTSGNALTGSAGTGSGATTIPSINYNAGNGLGIWAHTSYSDSQTVTQPSGYTQRSSSTDGSLKLATRNDTSGATSTGTGSTTTTDTQWTFAATILEPNDITPIAWTRTL